MATTPIPLEQITTGHFDRQSGTQGAQDKRRARACQQAQKGLTRSEHERMSARLFAPKGLEGT